MVTVKVRVKVFFTHFTHSGMWACLCLKKEEKKEVKTTF